MPETAMKPEAATTTPKKPRQGRSPAFPFISLGKAIDRIEAFRVAEGGRPKHFSPLSSAFKVWGIGAKTGPAAQTAAALGHYGLFEFQGSGEDRSARLTDLAFNILLDKQPVSRERDHLIRQAALNPRIHAELWQKWEAALPSDATLETYLVRDRGFSEGGARALIAEYKETIGFAKLNQPANIPENETDDAFNVGDSVNWESEGQIQWPKPWKVVEIATHEDGQRFLRVEGVDEDAGQSGWIPMSEAVPAEAAPQPNEGSGRTFTPPPPPPSGARKEVTSLDEGVATLVWPEEISAESYGDFEAWLNSIMRKARRRAGVPEPKKSSKSD